jgi:SAM-dependent methyltransferase
MAEQVTVPPISLFSSLRWDAVERHVRRIAPATIVEFGCGVGGFGARLSGMATYTGVEPDETSYAIAASRIEPLGGTVVNGEHHALPEGAEFDLVCAFEVLEHIEDDKGTLGAWASYVRPGGHMLLSVPAWSARYGMLDEKAGHLRRYDPDTLREMMTSAGLDDPRVEVIGWPLGYVLDGARNLLAARRRGEYESRSMDERTAASARFSHPRGRTWAVATEVATLPFRHLQRLRPEAGTNLVAVARRSG